MSIDISDLDKAQVLLALYENARPRSCPGITWSAHTTPSLEEAREQLDRSPNVILFKGRYIGLSLDGDVLHADNYDLFNGQLAAESAVNGLRARLETDGMQTARL